MSDLELHCCESRRDTVEVCRLLRRRISLRCFEGRDEAMVNLDRASVEKLHAWLGAWLERDDD